MFHVLIFLGLIKIDFCLAGNDNYLLKSMEVIVVTCLKCCHLIILSVWQTTPVRTLLLHDSFNPLPALVILHLNNIYSIVKMVQV